MKKLALILVFTAPFLFAADVNLTESDSADIEIEVALTPEEATPQKLKEMGFEFSRLPIENEGFQTGREGLPEVPVIHRWLVIQDGAKYRFESSPGTYKLYKNIRLYPAQPDFTEEETPSFKIKKGAYLKNVWYGSQRVKLGKRVKLGEATLLPISFSPASYNPVRRELKVFEKIHVRVMTENPESTKKPIALSQFAAGQISELALNGKSFLKKNQVRIQRKRILVVYGEGFLSFATDLAELHEAGGIEVSLLRVEPQTSASQLKGRLQEEYQNLKMDSILFVGDESSIPLRDFGGKTGDFSYSLLSGSDQVSDVSVGRIPVKNETQSQMMLSKTRRYLELSTQGYLNKKVMLIAHYQDYPGKYTKNMENVRNSPNSLGLEFNTQYGGEKANNSTVVREAQTGYAIINYRGHGSSTAWASWGSDGASFSLNQIKTLPDVDTSLAFIFNVACSNGAIQNSSPALVERQLFPNDNPESYQGAIGTMGATAPSLTEVNHRFNLNLFSFLQEAGDISIGNVYSLANNKMTKDNDGSATSNTKMYVLYSNPLLIPWIR